MSDPLFVTYDRHLVLLALLLLPAMSQAQEDAERRREPPLIPLGRPLPRVPTTSVLELRPLTVADADADFHAIDVSRRELARRFPGYAWPTSVQENRVMIALHKREADAHRSFAYSVTTVGGRRILGCVYISVSRKRGYEAEVALWIRSDEPAALDAQLYRVVKEWVTSTWGLGRVAFPGRDIPWAVWRSLDDRV